MTRDADGVLRGLAPGFGAGARYGFRVQGPYDPKRGLRFDAVQIAGRPLRLALRPPVRAPSVDVQVRRGHRPAHAEGDRRRAARGRAGTQAHRARRAGHLRAQPARLLAAQSGDPRSRARDVRGPRSSRVDRASGEARRHRGRDHARRHVRRRPAYAPARALGRLGLQFRRVRLARSASGAGRLGRRSSSDRCAACGGHGGHSRRRLQPQRRKRPARADAVVPRPRQ